jgi:hypothetical protein
MILKGVIMGRFNGKVTVGLRDKETGDLIRVYPYDVEGDDREIEEKVKTWYYQQGCREGEMMLSRYYVDSLTDTELKNYKAMLKH